MEPRSGYRSTWEMARGQAEEAMDPIIVLPGGDVKMFFRKIPPCPKGFLMGSRGKNSHEEPIHRVILSQDYYLGTFVVTQEQWGALWPLTSKEYPAGDSGPGEKPSQFKGPRHPVERIDWYDANRFCRALTQHAQETNQLPSGYTRFCLPTESEWEWACRGGSETEYWNGDGEGALAEVGWFDGNSGDQTHLVDEVVGGELGRVEVHPFGLFGMHGNVWEWCHDLFENDAYRLRKVGCMDPESDLRQVEWDAWEKTAPANRHRVIRGGSWGNSAWWCRSACRGRGWPVVRIDLGFRVCLVRGPGNQLE